MKFLVITAALTLAGCSGDSLPQKDYDPEAIAKAVMSAFDSDDDGTLTEDELQACPPLRSARARIDVNQDGMLDAPEISGRVAAYAAMSQFIVSEVAVKLGRRPISGAEVTLKLTDFMSGGPTKFIATTAASGVGMPQSSPESLLGFPPGFYDVEVVHEGKTWNFGVELADDNPSVSRLEFDLKEK